MKHGALKQSAKRLARNQCRASLFYTPKSTFSQASVIDFCSRNKEEELDAEARLDLLINENPAHIQISDLSDHPQALDTSLKAFSRKNVNSKLLLPHLSRTAHLRRKAIGANSFDILNEAQVKEAFIISGIVKSGLEIARKNPNKFYEESAKEEFEDFIKEALQIIPDLKFALPLYSDGHILTQKTTAKGTNPLRIEVDNLLEKISRICDISGLDPQDVVSKIILQHSFDPEKVEEACEMVKRRIGDIPTIPTILHLGNPKVVYAFSRDGLITYPKPIRDITERLLQNSANTEEFQKILREEGNPLIIDMVSKLSKFAPKLTFYVENDLHNLLEILDSCRDQGFISNVKLDQLPETPTNSTKLKFRKELDHERNKDQERSG